MSPNWNQWAVDLNPTFTTRVQNGVAQTLTWDHQNCLVSVTGSGINESYLYNADGQRIKKTSNGTATYYPNQYYEQYGTSVDKYYYFNGQPIALRRNGTLYYLHQDQLGNVGLVTSGGNPGDAQGFYAYGRLRSGIIGVERSFTAPKGPPQKDFGTGLIYFKARYYDPELGIFISPDTVVPDPGNIFDYNRYMFVRGNPLKYVDANGHEPIHHSNYPCSYTACVEDPMTGNSISVSNWTPELHEAYYPDPSNIPSEPLDLTQAKKVAIQALIPKTGASSAGFAVTVGLGLDVVGNIGVIYADAQGNVNFGGASIGIGGNTGANVDGSIFYNSMPGASNVDIYEGYTVNVGSSAGEGVGGGGEINITRDSATNQPTVGYTTAFGISAKINIPAPPVEFYGNVTRTWLAPARVNLYDWLDVPRPTVGK